MGGSGGFFSRYIPTGSLSNSIEEIEKKEYESNVNKFCQELLIEVNTRDKESIDIHLENIKEKLVKDIEGTIKLIYGGSIKKHTYLEGISDVDMLCLINDSELLGLSSKEILNSFAAIIQQRLPKTEINVGDLAITIKFTDGKSIQILPSIKTKTGYKIANKEGWSNVIKPDEFAKKLTEVNQKNNGMVVPIIKLAKYIISKKENLKEISGYHAESIAIESFKNYQGNYTYKEMLKQYFEKATEVVKSPIRDSTNQSLHVDDSLGKINSDLRIQASRAFDRITKKMVQADLLTNLEVWKNIFDE